MEWWLELLVVLRDVAQEIDQVALEYSSEWSFCLSWRFSFFLRIVIQGRLVS